MLLKSAVYASASSLAGLFLIMLCAKPTYLQNIGNRLIILLLYCISIAFVSPDMLIYNTAAGLIVPLFARDRRQVAPIYIFALLVQPTPSASFTIAGTYLLPLTPIVTLTIGAVLTAMVRSDNTPRKWSSAGTCLLVIFSVLLWPSVRSTSLTNFMRSLLDMSLIFLAPYYIIRKSVSSLDNVKLLFVALIAAIAALSTLAIFEARTGWPIYRVIFEHYGNELTSGASVKIRGGLLRSAGPYTEPLSLAFELCLGTLLALTNRSIFRSRLAHYAVSALMLAGMFAPQSRGAWLAVGAGMIIFALFTGQARTLVKIGITVPALAVITFMAGSSIPFIGNMLGMNETGVIGKDYRQTLLERGWQEAQGNLVFGQSIDVVFYKMRDMTQGEGIVDFVNQFLAILLFSGLVGLIPFIIAIIWPMIALRRARSISNRNASLEIAFVGASFGAIIVLISLMPLLGRGSMSLSIMLALAGILSQLKPPRPRSY